MAKNIIFHRYAAYISVIISIIITVYILNDPQDFLKLSKNTNGKFGIKSLVQKSMFFEKNMGQFNTDAPFVARNNASRLDIYPTKLSVKVNNDFEMQQSSPRSITMNIANSNISPKFIEEGKISSKTNYFKGRDPNKWLSKVPNYKKLIFEELYPGIDIVYYGRNGKLEFDFKLSPNADPRIIKLEFQDTKNLKLDEEGNLILGVGLDSLIFRKPIAYQEINGIKNRVLAKYIKLDEQTFGFVIDNYNKNEELIIDPVIEYSTYLKSSWKAEDIVVDKDGFIYITGDDCCDVFVTKLHPDSSDFIYSTYFGGDLDDFGLGIDVDTAGYVYVTGETQSDNFPTQNAKQPDFGGALWVDGDAFVTKLSKDGASLEYSTYLGGESSDIGTDIKVDIDGNAYVAGETNSSNFPIWKAYQSNLKNYEHEIFITKFNASGSDHIFSTFFGGSGDEESPSIALDEEHNIYITGFTWSLDLETTPGVYKTAGKSGDAFVTKMNAEGSDLIFSTYLTGENDPSFSNVDWGTGIAVNGNREVYVVGTTASPLFPTVNAIQENHGGNVDGFVTKLKPDGSDLLFSTFLGGSGYEEHLKIVVDAGGNAFITGQTGSDNFPIKNPNQNSLKGHIDAFVSVISSDGSELFFSTYLGGSDWESGRGIALADNSHIFVTGHSSSDDFPLKSPLLNSSKSAFLTEFSLDDSDITWTNKTANYSLPNGIKVFEGTRIFPKLKVYYIDADLNRPELSVRPYIRGSKQNVKNFHSLVGAYASINGGFFYGSSILSAVVYPNDLKVKNIEKINRKVNNNTKTYPVIRSLFSMKEDRSFSVDWIYHISNEIFTNQIFTYENPLAYNRYDPNPKPAPTLNNGKIYTNILTGIGGGPVLIKDGKINVTFDEEILWGSGVGYANRDPRSAVGVTADKHIIFMVVDGRITQSEGVGLPELAEIMLNLDCVEAINLDGGGSSQLAIGNAFVNNPKEHRLVPSIFSIVHTDSLNLNKEPISYHLIDTEGDNVEKVGDWIESDSPGASGSSNALIIPVGEGNNYIQYNLGLNHEAEYEVYAWWVADSDRSKDTPFIITHKNGLDTVRVDQTGHGSFWNIIGNYTFTGSNLDVVKITDGATTGGFVCADAIRIVSEDKITEISSKVETLPNQFELLQNYPNPFNPKTKITYSIPRKSRVKILVFDSLGREILILLNKEQVRGIYELDFDGSNLASGIYFYSLTTNNISKIKKMVILK